MQKVIALTTFAGHKIRHMLKTKIKAGSITNLTDARYFAARGVHWLGFDLSPGSDNYMAPAQALAIKEWVDGVEIVGEYNLEPAEEIRTAAAELGLDAVQLSMVAADTVIRELVSELPVIKEIVPGYYHSAEDLKELFESAPEGIRYFLLNLEKNSFTWQDIQAGSPFSLATIREICREFPVLLALNFKPAEVTEILEELPLKGLHLKGGDEEKVGFKSFDDLDEILDLLEDTDE
ncbi:N-(5'-phosphoribosyl)anthranilate isomerase [Flavilitoribacter nigricans DSM 23189 = NBRC 102662]|uniref:phosphoribosylanthranilate isomerase n=2 Tax=Flavilitoribacter TaxID=2762562 RepID=A0A2D0NFW1_FLAN2|nr:N-(5'-phosphoribosyl)anthranilate isomerase [Flavilitoribacter nigricans DSM 23189 = NBRC 102662]